MGGEYILLNTRVYEQAGVDVVSRSTLKMSFDIDNNATETFLAWAVKDKHIGFEYWPIWPISLSITY